jgi:antiviral helicase SKI2
MYDEHTPRLFPNNDSREVLLKRLGLDALPSKDEINETIEKHWLTPKDTLPAHWLSHYQM